MSAALTIAQPWASLIVAGVKMIETRPAPPNGPMRPDGVRGLPGLRIERGERIAIHAAAADTDRFMYQYLAAWDALGEVIGGDAPPHGKVLGSVAVLDALPIVARVAPPHGPAPWDGHRRIFVDEGATATCDLFDKRLLMTAPRTLERIYEQLPLGDFTPGRWAWLLGDPVPTTERCPNADAPPGCSSYCSLCHGQDRCDPIPAKGKQGVWEWSP